MRESGKEVERGMKREGEEGRWREEHSCTTLINHSDFFIFPFSLYVIISQLIAIVAGTIEILSKANTLVCCLHYLPAVFSISRCFPRILPFNCSCYFPLNCSSALLLSLSDFSLCAFLITNNAHATLNFACDAFGTHKTVAYFWAAPFARIKGQQIVGKERIEKGKQA